MAEAGRSYDLPPSEVENRVDDARKGMANALKSSPLDVRQGLLDDGIVVPVTKLCAWFDVLRRTVCYKPTKAAPIKALIEEDPSFGCRTVAWLAPVLIRQGNHGGVGA